MNWLHGLRQFNRQQMILVLAACCLGGGAILPWYDLPPTALEVFNVNLDSLNFGRFLSAFLAIFTILWLWVRPSSLWRLLFWASLVMTLLFPCWLTHWAPNVQFVSTAYFQQKLAVFQHVEFNFSEVQSQWKQNINLSPFVPINSIITTSVKENKFFQMPSFNRIIKDWLGFGNVFFEFMQKGWVLTISGILASLIAIYLNVQDEELSYLLKDIKTIFIGSVLLLSLLLFILFLPNIIDYNLKTEWAKGNYTKIITTSQQLVKFYPAWQGDTVFLQRWAEASYYGHQPNLSLINFVRGLESYNLGNLEEAADYFQQSLAQDPQQFFVRGYLATVWMNLGVKNFNEKKSAAACDNLKKSLDVFPDQVEALYDLMIIYAINNDFDRSAQVAQQIIDNQKYFQLPSLGLLGQAYLHSAWASYRDGNLEQAWLQYRQSVDKRAW